MSVYYKCTHNLCQFAHNFANFKIATNDIDMKDNKNSSILALKLAVAGRSDRRLTHINTHSLSHACTILVCILKQIEHICAKNI